MSKITFNVLLFLIISNSICQTVLENTPPRGIYDSFEEFKTNTPSITDSFYTESKVRTQENWEGTLSLTPRYAENNKKVKKVWGFSDGQNLYAFHQWEFFKVIIDSSEVGFYAYKELDNSGAIAAGVAGGAIGGGIYAAIAVENAKKKRVYYKIDLSNGEFINEKSASAQSKVENKEARVIIYRRDKQQKNEALTISFSDTTTFQLIPNSLLEFKIPVSSEPIKVCYGENLANCINIEILSDEIKYFEGSNSTKTNEVSLEQVKTEVGEFNAKQARYFQDKREDK